MMLFLVDDSETTFEFFVWANTVDEAAELWRDRLRGDNDLLGDDGDERQPRVFLVPLRAPPKPGVLWWHDKEEPGMPYVPKVRDGEWKMPAFEFGLKAIELGAIVTPGGKW